MTRSNNDRFDGRAVNAYLDDDGDWLAHLVELPEVSALPQRARGRWANLLKHWKVCA